MPANTVPLPTTITPARGAALAASAIFMVNGVVDLFADDASDHMSGLGLVSEVSAGLAFLAGAYALIRLVPVHGWKAVLWWLAPVGMAIAGVTMLLVPVVGEEPSGLVFMLAVIPTFAGQIAAGVIGVGRRWPWWTGVALALFIPIMFTLPFNGFLLALVWLAVALTSRVR